MNQLKSPDLPSLCSECQRKPPCWRKKHPKLKEWFWVCERCGEFYKMQVDPAEINSATIGEA